MPHDVSGLTPRDRVQELLPAQFLGMVKFLWPNFVERKGCVLLPWAFDNQTLDAWWDSLGGDQSKIEAVVNHQHISDLFPEHDLAEGEGDELARAIARCWSAALQARFPDRRFSVDVYSEPDDYGPTVTFSQVRSA